MVSQKIRFSLMCFVLATSSCTWFKKKKGSKVNSLEVPKYIFKNEKQKLLVQVLGNSAIQFGIFKANDDSKAANFPLSVTDQIAKITLERATNVETTPDGFETQTHVFTVDSGTLCLKFFEKGASPQMKTGVQNFCPSENLAELTWDRADSHSLYGLGQVFLEPGNPNGDWMGKVRESDGEFGNVLSEFKGAGGANGNVQIPFLTSIGNEGNYGFLFDDIRKQRWDFTGQRFKVSTQPQNALRGFLWLGKNTTEIRKNYFNITGFPKVPPKSVLGLWLAEFSYLNWQELYTLHREMRLNRFPMDGFLLDLMWFGGVTTDDPKSRMGSLEFDTKQWPNPEQIIPSLRDTRGVGVIPIEESYVSLETDVYADFASKEYFAHNCENKKQPSVLSGSWWGRGAMLDWTNPAGAKEWHDRKRKALINLGVVGHWIDLGEPEQYDKTACYFGVLPNGWKKHWDMHNVFTLKWAQSISEGYERDKINTRYFITARSGAAGLQRYGAGLWSGDIGGTLFALAGHLRNQMHLTYSGIDFYSGDIGGFHRKDANWTPFDSKTEMKNYTIWYANAMLFDFPARPHVVNMNFGDSTQKLGKETAPTRMGHLQSNLANTLRRYELVPYLNNVLHSVGKEGSPLVAPLSFYFEKDLNTKGNADQKLLGEWLMAGILTNDQTLTRQMYFPKGGWFDFDDGKYFVSKGEPLGDMPTFRNGVIKLPLHAREGAIVPLMNVSGRTMNVQNAQSTDAQPEFISTIDHTLRVRIFGSKTKTEIVHKEDDGVHLINFASNEKILTTKMSQVVSDNRFTVVIEGTQGNIAEVPKFPVQRKRIIELVSPAQDILKVTINAAEPQKCATMVEFESGKDCLFIAENRAWLRTSNLGISDGFEVVAELENPAIQKMVTVTVACNQAQTVAGENIYVVGNIPELGSNNERNALRLKTNIVTFPNWGATLLRVAPGTKVQAKCLKIRDNDSEAWRNAPSGLDSVVQRASLFTEITLKNEIFQSLNLSLN